VVKTGAEYRESLNDGRQVFLNGETVADPFCHPRLLHAAQWIADIYDRFYQPGPEAINPLFTVPRSPDDLRRRLPDLEGADLTLNTTSQSLLALMTAAPALADKHPRYVEAIHRYFEHIAGNDLRVVECITDAKGDRSLAPSKQADPDSYLHVIERRDDGVVIRGAKLHITGAPLAHEMVVMPTKQMKEGEEEYAIACAVPVNAPGVRIVATTYSPHEDDEADFPISTRFNMPDGFVIFDDVFVPNEMIFLDGEVQFSGNFAHALGLWERLGGTAVMADEADILVGFAALVAEANGLERIPHVREKISEMIIYATLIRAGLEAALVHVGTTVDGMVYPSELYTNAAKFYGASEYNHMLRHLHDIAGGAVATAPSNRDFRLPELSGLLRKYMATKPDVDGAYRNQLMRAIRDFTADALGGWRFVTNLQSGGGLYAQRLVTRKHYDLSKAKQAARQIAGLDD
jgi:4-hydroxybutyryl-CoA dehydratase/vinylacetyl-CoA-Delta-isomerase